MSRGLQQDSERMFPTAVPHQYENHLNLLLIKSIKFPILFAFTAALADAAVGTFQFTSAAWGGCIYQFFASRVTDDESV